MEHYIEIRIRRADFKIACVFADKASYIDIDVL